MRRKTLKFEDNRFKDRADLAMGSFSHDKMLRENQVDVLNLLTDYVHANKQRAHDRESVNISPMTMLTYQTNQTNASFDLNLPTGIFD